MMIRPFTYHEGNAGIWDVSCEACPLRPHAEALAVKLPTCMHGIATNMQGHLVLGRCKHLAKDGVTNEGVDCRWHDSIEARA